MLNLHRPTPVFSSDVPFVSFFLSFFLVNFASAGTPSSTFVQYSRRERLLFFAVLRYLSSVQSSPVWLNVSCKGEQGGSPPLKGVPAEAEEAYTWLQKLFFQLVCRPNTSSSLHHSRTEKLKFWSIRSQSLRNMLLLLSWSNSSRCLPLGGGGGNANGVQSKGHNVRFALFFVFTLFKKPSTICIVSHIKLFISVISGTE